MTYRKLAGLLSVIVLVACCLSPVVPRDQGTAAIADLVIRNAKIVTIDRANPRAEAIAVRGDRILAVTSNQAIANIFRRARPRFWTPAGGWLRRDSTTPTPTSGR
jgi:hypothetical protein